jgi:hypothetical protein
MSGHLMPFLLVGLTLADIVGATIIDQQWLQVTTTYPMHCSE